MAQTVQRSFVGGEIAPALRSRADLVKYTTGLALCENNIIRPQGGVYSRPGTKFICELDDSSAQGRLIPFQFNTEQTYILIFENLKMRVIKDGGLVLSGGGPTVYELTTPYTTADLARLQFTQSADVMTIVHPDYDPRNLSRTADDAWSLDTIDFSPNVDVPDWQTTVVANISDITQANPAVVTTSSDHGLLSGDIVLVESVGGMTEVNDLYFEISVLTATTFQLLETDSTAYTAYTSGGTATRDALAVVGEGAGDYDKKYSYVVTTVNNVGEESLPSPVRSITTKSLSVTAGVKLVWEQAEDAAYYRVYKDTSESTLLHGWIGDSKTTEFYDYNVAPITSDTPPISRDPFTTTTASITAMDFTDGVLVTATGHGFNSGDTILIEDVNQPTDFNDLEFSIEVVDEDTFYLINSLVGPFASYTSGGTATRSGSNPSTVAYYQQRRVYANTTDEPQTVFTSQTGIYNSLRTSSPARDSDAVTFTINSKQVNEVRHLLELDSLVILTSGGEYRVTEGQDEVLTPSTVGVRKQSNNGASWTSPVTVNDTIIYIQEKGGRVRDLNFEFVDDRYKGNDLSIMAEHLFEDYTIDEMAFATEPYGILWCIRNDGRVLGLTYQREHQVWAWHQHVSMTSAGDSEFESVAVISEDGRDAPYFIVKRTINGNTVRYVERMEKRYVTGPEDVWCVDSGLQYNGAAATNISGLDHLEGEPVAVVADGHVVNNLTVSGGAITLPRAASKVTVGLSYQPVIELLDIDVSSSADTLKGKDVSVSRVILEVENSRGGWVGPKKDDGSTGVMREIKPRYETDAYAAIQLKTWKEEVRVESQWSLGGGIRIEQRAPMPLTILSVIPEVDVS